MMFCETSAGEIESEQGSVPGPAGIMSDVESTKHALTGKTLVVGLGKTGFSCARFLSRQGLDVLVTDSRKQPPELAMLNETLPDVKVFLGGFTDDVFTLCDQILLSPGVSLQEPAVARAIAQGIPVYGDVELFARNVNAPIVAVTGSNGKSTVTAMVAEMIRQADKDVHVGGNIGIPVLDLLDSPTPDFYVLELSSFQLETCSSLNCATSVVLNISPDHMDRYRDLVDYRAAKKRIFQGNGTIVINDDESMATNSEFGVGIAGRNCIHFGLGTPVKDSFGLIDRNGEGWLAKGEQALMPRSELLVNGLHNVSNALAALALCDAIEIPMAECVKALRVFKGLPHRMEWVATAQGITWINDSKGTNVGATSAALRGLNGKVVLIAGGQAKGADFTPLKKILTDKGRAVILLGQDAEQIKIALDNCAPISNATDMADAVEQARHFAKTGDTVLLSPACASFDMFSGYEQRGQVYVAAVRELSS